MELVPYVALVAIAFVVVRTIYLAAYLADKA